MSELTQRVKAKYPQYANVPDADLEKRVLQKYPQYKKYASKTVGGFFENVGKSAVSAVTDIAGAAANVLNPDLEKNTLVNLGKLGVDTAKLVAGDPSELNRASQVLNFYKQRYGGVKNIGETFYNDPVGLILDASVVLGGAGAAVKGVGTAGKLAGLTKAGTTLTKAGAAIDPLVWAGKGVRGVSRHVGEVAPLALEKQANKVATRGLGNPERLEKIQGVAGRPVGQLMEDYRITNRSPDTAGRAIDMANDLYDEKLLAANRNISVGQYLKNLDEQIRQLEPESLLSDTAKQELDALIVRRAGIERYLTQQGAVPLEMAPNTAREIKSKIYKDVRPSTYNPQYQGSGSQLAAKRAYQGLISSIDDVAPGTRQLGRDQAALIQLQDVFERSAKRGEARQLVSMPKLIASTTGGSLGGVGGALGAALGETIFNSPQASAVASRGLRTTSKFLKNPTTQKVFSKGSKAISSGFSFGKASSRALPSQLPATNQQSPVVSTKPNRSSFQEQQKQKTLPSIVPSPATPDPKKVKPLEYKPPKSVFTNKSAFGSNKKVTRGSFY